LEAAELVIDAGPCEFGIESTVVDLSEGTPRLLRPGAISASQLEAVLHIALAEGDRGRSPGGHHKHYSPRARVHLVAKIASNPGLILGPLNGANQISMPPNAREYAAKLYDALHELDKQGAPEIWIEAPPETPEWAAVWDRLIRATSDG
jgi:L-threonylcarbamoyladenylate synthase